MVTKLQIAALVLTMVGTILMFFNSPLYSSQVYVYNIDEDLPLKKDKRKRRLAKIGLCLVAIGIIIQMVLVFGINCKS